MSLQSGLHALTQFGREAARMVLPSRCIVCAGELSWRRRRGSCCDRCWGALPRIETAQCRICAIPLPGPPEERGLCIPCGSHPGVIEWCGAWGLYEHGLERILHAFKFEGHDFLAPHLAGLLAEERLAAEARQFDRITAIPMHRAKLRRRGYNQAALLGRELARRICVPFDEGLLRKLRNNEIQSTLPREKRAANVRGAFVAGPKCQDRAVLVIDDISTTGETLREAAAELMRCGASRVGAMVVARVRDVRQ